MYKVLRLVNRFNLGGPTYNAANLTKYLGPEFETLLVGGTIDPTEASSEYILKDLNIEYTVIPEMRRELNPIADYQSYQKICAMIREFHPDIVHTHASKAGALGRMAAKKMKVPVIVHTFHGNVLDAYFGKLKSEIFIRIERYLASQSQAIVAISEQQKAELVNRFHLCEPEKIHIIPLGFDLSRFQENMVEKRKQFRSRFQLTDDEIAVGIVGRLVPVKNHDLFIEAFANVLRQTSKKIKGFIVGNGEEWNRLNTLSESLGLGDHLIFTSWIKEADLVMAGMDIIVLTSNNEGTPVSLIEAQAAGRPIISTSVGGIENVVFEGKTALLSEPGNIEQLTMNLLRMVEDSNLREELSYNGSELVLKKFHYQRLVSDMRILYFDLLKKTKNSANFTV